MGQLSREERHKLVNQFVSMPMAAHRVFAELYGRKGSDDEITAVANALRALVTVYEISEQDEIRELTEHDTRGARFADCGGALIYDDGRKPLHRLAVMQIDLAAAIGVLKATDVDLARLGRR